MRADAPAVQRFESSLADRELRVFHGFDSPLAIQRFLDDIPYSAEPIYRCPKSVLRDRLAHCFDGALLAAAGLRRMGYRPLIVDLLAERDDDHLLALWQRDGRWGAIAKSNYVGLRFREPVYRTLRELAMSYFEGFYNVEKEKTLRGYTVPLDLRAFDRLRWMESDEQLETIARRLDTIRRISLLSPAMVAGLALLDERSYRAGMLGVNAAGLYRPQGGPPDRR
ncbi:MAG TPA: hypothetical protein VHR45_24625 [Thermoanaerobaculia bacterium]|nr:hypothetical protein [Thermoanaerobaculia bacterium]